MKRDDAIGDAAVRVGAAARGLRHCAPETIDFTVQSYYEAARGLGGWVKAGSAAISSSWSSEASIRNTSRQP
jgi:hypothetical protein